MRGKNATPGLPCLYHLMSGQIFYSEAVKEDGDSFIFDCEKTVLVTLQQGKGSSVHVTMVKLSETGFKPKQNRVFKSNIALVSDTGEPSIIQKAKEALTGLVLPGAVN
jgi:hypothetical protein